MKLRSSVFQLVFSYAAPFSPPVFLHLLCRFKGEGRCSKLELVCMCVCKGRTSKRETPGRGWKDAGGCTLHWQQLASVCSYGSDAFLPSPKEWGWEKRRKHKGQRGLTSQEIKTHEEKECLRSRTELFALNKTGRKQLQFRFLTCI